jgi:hypothetical protein
LSNVVFRDAFISVLSAATPGNLEEVSAKLDAAGNTLEYRRYAETLFEILIAGRLLGKALATCDEQERNTLIRRTTRNTRKEGLSDLIFRDFSFWIN